MVEKDKVKKALEKKKNQQGPQEPKSREVHPLDSNIIFREEVLLQLGRIANALEILIDDYRKPRMEVEE